MKKFLIASALILGLVSCGGLKKQINENIDFGVRALIVPRIAIGKFLVESTESICELNMIKQPKPIFMRSFNAHFSTDKNSFDIAIDSIDISVINNQMTFGKINIPPKPQYLNADTIEVKVTCKYQLLDSLADHSEKCLSGNYVIYGYSIVQKDKYVPCTF